MSPSVMVAPRSPRARARAVFVALVTTLFCACQRRAPEPETHPAPATSSDPPPAAFLAPSSPHEHMGGTSPHGDMGNPATEQKGQLKWTHPQGWSRQEQSSPMRVATYRVPHAGSDQDDAEKAVFHFSGGEGGDGEASLRRWGGQFTDKIGDAKLTERGANGLKAQGLESE